MPETNEKLTQLECFPDLEVSIPKATKINIVPKGILKLSDIPREDEFRFNSRCSELSAKWTLTIEAAVEDEDEDEDEDE
jgi:hypothetical protein